MNRTEFEAGWLARVTLFTHSDGGRRNEIELLGRYRPHVRVDDGELLGVRFHSDGALSSLAPGETGTVVIEPLYESDYSALTTGTRFTILEGPHAIGTGTVLTSTA